jgi:glyoxylate carboligase
MLQNVSLKARTCGQVLVDQLLLHGADTGYCVPGESYLDVLDALYDVQDRFTLINARHEAGAANMAEAYGKCQRRIKNRSCGGAKVGQWRDAKRHGACAHQIAGACHGALARRANSATCDQVAAWAFRARLWPSR